MEGVLACLVFPHHNTTDWVTHFKHDFVLFWKLEVQEHNPGTWAFSLRHNLVEGHWMRQQDCKLRSFFLCL